MRQRQFITLFGGVVFGPSVLPPLPARAQQPARMRRIGVRDGGEVERGITAFARGANDGLIMAARHRSPSAYPDHFCVADGGLICYGAEVTDQYRETAGYVDRITRGEKPTDPPVQAPAKYETALSMKTAKALGFEVPATVLVHADEVIE